MTKKINKCQQLETVLRALVKKLDEVGEATKGIFTMAWAHGMEYKGPNYGEELAAAKKLLCSI